MNEQNTMMEQKRKTVTIYETTFEKLQKCGRFGETWDQVLNRLAEKGGHHENE